MQLAQLRPDHINLVSIYQPEERYIAVIKTILVCNLTANPVTYRLCHDNDGTTYDETTALAWDVIVPANTTDEWFGFYPMDNANGHFAVQTGTADAINFTLYGARIG